MCGIAGFIDLSRHKKNDELEGVVRRMADSLRHRGPDDKGEWADENAGIALGHRRLSIIDLSREGHQPMVSGCGRYVMVYNGEVYNFRILREKLAAEGIMFRGHSDTEVMLAAISRYGVENAVKEFNGMFAFALWDRQEKNLCLCRDRLGEKPLYYGIINNSFIFASELKAFRQVPGSTREIDRQAVALYLRYNCIPAPYSIYKDIRKLLPGTLLSFKVKSGVRINSYWSASDIAKASNNAARRQGGANILEETKILLKDAVKMRMESDVPLGVFLSGGIDSSLITAFMQAQSDVAVKTFTIGFGDPKYNEAEDAREVAQYLGTSHTCFYATAEDALKVIPALPEVYDEPFSDSSQIPTILVSRMARQYVTVCLSGDGGDEIFGGYNRYAWLERIWRKTRYIPYGIRKSLAHMVSSCPSDKFENLFEKIKFILPGQLRLRNAGIKFQKFSDVLSAMDSKEAYINLTSHWKEPEKLLLGRADKTDKIEDLFCASFLSNPKRQMMYSDMVNYLPNDILVKVDRASMSAGLECRAVYLDHRVVEHAWSLPVSALIDNTGSKLILRSLLRECLPSKYWERPKMGFAVPIDSWLRGPLKNWADDLLSGDYVRRQGFFKHKTIEEKWKEHKKGIKNRQFELWDILMFNAWLDFYDRSR